MNYNNLIYRHYATNSISLSQIPASQLFVNSTRYAADQLMVLAMYVSALRTVPREIRRSVEVMERLTRMNVSFKRNPVPRE